MAEFSEDIVTEILLKLPVKSLLRFRSVSKQWQTLIRSPSFIKLHMDRPTGKYISPMLILRDVVSTQSIIKTDNLYFDSVTILMTLLFNDETLDYEDIELVRPKRESRVSDYREHIVKVLGPFNGVFCITCTEGIVLFNPTTRQCMKVPCSPSSSRNSFTIGVRNHDVHWNLYENVGFGFDRVSNDYKVVRFLWCSSRRFTNVEIFSLNSSRWRVKEKIVLPCSMYGTKLDGLFFNGGFHWLGGGHLHQASHILVFYLEEEAFKSFDLPDKLYIEHVSLSVLDESLSVIFDNRSDQFFIWVMSKYGVYESWRKLYIINLGVGNHRPLSFSKDGEYILWTKYSRKLMSFNVKTRAIKELQIKEGLGVQCALRYTESLVSLKRCKRKRVRNL